MREMGHTHRFWATTGLLKGSSLMPDTAGQRQQQGRAILVGGGEHGLLRMDGNQASALSFG